MPNAISTWLVLGPIYNKDHQGSHSGNDNQPTAADIIKDIDNNQSTLDPKQITDSSRQAPKAGDLVDYGNGRPFPKQTCTWRIMGFHIDDWGNLSKVGNDIRDALVTETIPATENTEDFAGKDHALAFFLVYVYSPSARDTNLCVMSDYAIRVWFNGSELLEPVRYLGDRDITEQTKESRGGISLRKGCNILLAAVANTIMEWGFFARIENDQGLKIQPYKMQWPTGIPSWLVLGPIYNENHQGGTHINDTFPTSPDIIQDIDHEALDPQEITQSLIKSPIAGDTANYGNGTYFPNKDYTWRIMRFSNVNWTNIHDIEDDVHKALVNDTIPPELQYPQSFEGKRHTLAFFLVYIHSPDAIDTKLCVMSDDSIRVWLNGSELEEPLRCIRERDINEKTLGSFGNISLKKGYNILMASVAETHVEWGFYAGIENDQGLTYTPKKPHIPELPKKPIKESANLSSSSFLGIGWSFPPEFIQEIGEVVMTADEADIDASLRILFGTAIGERFLNPKFGLDMHDMLFEPMSTTLKTLMVDQVKMAILIYEPRIKLLSLDLDTTNQYEGKLSILVEYEVRSTNSRYNLVYPFNTTIGMR